MFYRVKEVAEMAGIAVRALHYYDHIGLLKPESVSPAGYRLYSKRDLERLQQVLFYKELGFSLHEIKRVIDEPGFDRIQALMQHKSLLLEKAKRLERLIETVGKTIDSIRGGQRMDMEEMLGAFDMSEIERHKQKYAEITKQRYGHSDTYKECVSKTSKYTEGDWATIIKRGNQIYVKIASLMDTGPTDPRVQEAIAEWRQHITDNFYDCSLEVFRGLGDLYVEDERFTASIDGIKPGLSAFLRDAMHAYCEMQQPDR